MCQWEVCDESPHDGGGGGGQKWKKEGISERAETKEILSAVSELILHHHQQRYFSPLN